MHHANRVAQIEGEAPSARAISGIPSRVTRVLCVDDRPDVTAAVQMLIQSTGSLECVGCLNTADNLVQRVKAIDPPPDVVILDATMPGTDPIAAARDLADDCPSVRTIVYSGYDDPNLTRRAKEAGAWGCVSKHEEPRILLKAVGEVAAGRAVWT
jgi:two-component system, NarL family, invasion response regulator UvrY